MTNQVTHTMQVAKLTYRDGKPVAEIWNGSWTVQLDTVWFLSVNEARTCVKPGRYDLVWDCL